MKKHAIAFAILKILAIEKVTIYRILTSYEKNATLKSEELLEIIENLVIKKKIENGGDKLKSNSHLQKKFVLFASMETL